VDESNTTCNALFNNRFNKPDRIRAYLLPSIYGYIDNVVSCPGIAKIITATLVVQRSINTGIKGKPNRYQPSIGRCKEEQAKKKDEGILQRGNLEVHSTFPCFHAHVVSLIYYRLLKFIVPALQPVSSIRIGTDHLLL
jgi:hypothetical protein